MRIGDILYEDNERLITLRSECSEFLHESNQLPLYKALPAYYQDIQKVKARLKKKTDDISNVFNKAFEHEVPNIRQRAIFGYSEPPNLDNDTDLFYILPINEYKFLYSKEVTHSSSNYKQVMDKLFETFQGNTVDIITDIVKYTYTTENLYEGIRAKSEIIFYSIPYYYAMRVSAYPNYTQIF